MQNRYCGDIGDFGKYGLLRHLISGEGGGERQSLRLGIVWYLVPDESGPNGQKISYLEDTKTNRRHFRECDAELWDKLSQVVNCHKRVVKSISDAGIFPPETVFFEKELSWRDCPKANTPAGREQRLLHREHWLTGALLSTSDCDLVFLDPDNGLQVAATKRYANRGPKYVYLDEAKRFCGRNRSLIIYQHIARNKKAFEQIDERREQIRYLTGVEGIPALCYHRGTARAFLVTPAEPHAELIETRLGSFLKGPWREHFTIHK